MKAEASMIKTPNEVQTSETSRTGREYPRTLVLFFQILRAINHSYFTRVTFVLMYAIAGIPAYSQQKFVNPVGTPSGYVPPGGYDTSVVVGAERTEAYIPALKNKNVAVIANQTSMVGKKHLVDYLLENEIK